MNGNSKRAREIFDSDNYTLVLCNEDEVITSSERGVAPLIELYRSGRDLSSFSAADKVVGRAAAFMYVLLGIKGVYAKCISRPAIEVLEKSGIELEYGECVERIASRDGKGLCPMESAVMGIDSASDAYEAILRKQKELSSISLG